LGGGLLLAILLGPEAAFVVIASVLATQAFFFADGGLLALVCNIFNLGFFPAFIAYPFIYRPLAGDHRSGGRAWAAALVAAPAGLMMGAFSVVLETKASGLSELPFGTFLLFMVPVHLAIGVVEGAVTATVVSFVARSRPVSVPAAASRSVAAAILIAALGIGGVASWFASTHPDGLEWAVARVTGRGKFPVRNIGFSRFQKDMAPLPDYGFKSAAPVRSWPAVNGGKTFSGIVGGLIVLSLAVAAGFLLKSRE
jgi:cobalt/nickel transport system permease protein